MGVRISPLLPIYSEKMNKIKTYFQEAYTELVHKVTWPTWTDLKSSSIVVMVASLLIAVVIFVMDFCFQHIFEAIYGLF